ncbi:MAG: hypothetical protein Q9166_005719 [cf. Caloplaca sp. 2 TL-2023]
MSTAQHEYDRPSDNYRPSPAQHRGVQSGRVVSLYLACATANLGVEKIAIGYLEMDVVGMIATLVRETSTPGPPAMNNGSPAIIDEGACPLSMTVDAAMWTEIMKDIDRLQTIAEAEAGVEVLCDANAHLNLVLHQVERSFWKEYHWTFQRKTFAITSPPLQSSLRSPIVAHKPKCVDQLDDVRIIRDRQTKVSRGFGFLRFPSIEVSKDFLERNYPSIYLYGGESSDSNNQAAKVRIAFSRERDERPRVDKEDMSTFGNVPDVKSQPAMNSGDSDASPNGAPSQFLILRGLEPTVTEDLFSKGVSKLYKPSRRSSPPSATHTKKGNAKVASTTGDANLGAKEGSLRRVLLVRDRKSNESWRYGFAEFATVDDAQAAIIRFNSFDKFTIASKPVTVDYIHAGVFVPVFTAEDPDELCFSPLGNTATRLAYWDKEAYVSELVVSSGSPKPSAASVDSQVKSAADLAAAAAEGEGLVQPGKESEVKAKKRKAEAATAAAKPKKFWSDRHAELHGIKPESTHDKESLDDSKPKTASSSTVAPANSTPTQTFANPEKKCCYLCSRQFKSEAEVNKHERLSQLHRNNLKNDGLVSQAQAKMTKAGLSTTPPQEDTSEYRDRAKERRAAFGATKKICLPLKNQASRPETAESSESEQPPPRSKGASLLGKMGWSAGEGLGAQGTGRTEAIATEMYVQGVGLGAQGGKIGDAVEEAGRNTKGGYAEFAERTRDKAKESPELQHPGRRPQAIMAASSPPVTFQSQGLQPALLHESPSRFQDGEGYEMMVLRFSHDTTEDEVDRQFLRTALDLGINVPQDPTTTLELVTKNVSALDLNSTPSAFRPPPSRTSDSTHPTSCSSSEQRGHTKTSSLTSSSMTSAPSSVNSASSRKSSYTKIKNGIRRISTLKRRKTIGAPVPPIPVPIAAIKTLRPLAQHHPTTVDQVPYVPISRIPDVITAPRPSLESHHQDNDPPASPDHHCCDPSAIQRSINHPQLKELRQSQIEERRRFIRFEADQHRLMRSRQEDTQRRLLDEHPQKVKAVQDRHLEALTSLEHRHLSAEIDLEQTLELERQACETRLKHMQAYCNSRSVVEGMPNRVVTKQHHRQLDQQYHVRNGMENLHTSRINVLREKQAKQLERIMAKQELEVEQLDTELATTMQKLATACQSETQMLKQEFAERRKRLVSRWSLAEGILRKRLENDIGETYGLLPPIPWHDRLSGSDENEDPVDDELARNARMAYDASTLNMI